MGQCWGADAFHGGDVGPVTGSQEDRAGRDCPVKELLLGRTPGGHDDVAGPGVPERAVVLRSLETDHVAEERHQG